MEMEENKDTNIKVIYGKGDLRELVERVEWFFFFL